MIKTILFDFYGIFLPDSYSVWLEKNSLKREGIFAQLIEALDRDVINETHFLGELSAILGREVHGNEIHPGQPEPNAEVIELLHELQTQYTINLFSNASKELRTKLEDLGLAPLFDEIIISSEIGHAKPSNEAFQIAIEKLGVKAPEIVFIDDNPHNVKAGNRNGMLAVQYTAVADLRLSLKTHQVL